MTEEWNNKILRVNLAVLRLFDVPTCVSEHCKSGAGDNYREVQGEVLKLCRLGLLKYLYGYNQHKNRGAGHKKYYVLHRKGQKLLDLFPEDHKFLTVNLEYLRLFKAGPIYMSELRNRGFRHSYTSIHKEVTKLIKTELIQLEITGLERAGIGIKKYYALSLRGKKLLDIFPEDLEDGEEVYAAEGAWKCPNCQNIVSPEVKECPACGWQPMPSCSEAYKTP